MYLTYLHTYLFTYLLTYKYTTCSTPWHTLSVRDRILQVIKVAGTWWCRIPYLNWLHGVERMQIHKPPRTRLETSLEAGGLRISTETVVVVECTSISVSAKRSGLILDASVVGALVSCLAQSHVIWRSKKQHRSNNFVTIAMVIYQQ
jgi:hypothetical protein